MLIPRLRNISVPQEKFIQQIRESPFSLCVNGGGIDPNPKAFTALLAGVIPIIRSFPGDRLYTDNGLPVVIIKEWHEDAVTVQKLKEWREELGPKLVDPRSRAEIRRKLMADYWFDKFSQKQ